MNRLQFSLAIPLTIILFATVTKWWYVIPEDAPDTPLFGFPFPFVCNGWHTSLSLQIFVLEFIVDILFYYFIVKLVLFFVDRFWLKNKFSSGFLIAVWVMAGFIITISGFWVVNPDNLFFIKRPFDFDVKETRIDFILIN